MKDGLDIEWTPGVETEPLPNLRIKSLGLAALVSFGLFCLLPLSEFVRPDEWIVRPADVPTYTPSPPAKNGDGKRSGQKNGTSHTCTGDSQSALTQPA